jgi:hypothetical protein
MNFCPYSAHIFSDLSVETEHTLLTIYGFLENWPRKAIISYGRELYYIFSSAIKPYGIMKIKNALVKSVYYFTEYNICSLVDNNINRGLSRTGCLRELLWPGRMEVLESWIKLRDEEPRDLYCNLCFVGVMRLKRMRSAGILHARG